MRRLQRVRVRVRRPSSSRVILPARQARVHVDRGQGHGALFLKIEIPQRVRVDRVQVRTRRRRFRRRFRRFLHRVVVFVVVFIARAFPPRRRRFRRHPTAE